MEFHLMRMPRRTLAAVSAAAVLSTVAVALTAGAAPVDDAARGGVVTSIIDALFGTDDADDADDATDDPADPVAATTPASSVPITATPTPQPSTSPAPLAAGAGDPAPSAEQCSDLRGDADEVLRCSFFSPSMSRDRKSTRLNSSHVSISYAVFCLKKKKPSYEIARRALTPY